MKRDSNRTAGGASTLAARYYVSEEVYALEMERIFSNRWLYVGRLSEIPDAGNYVLFEIDNESLILLRDRSGEPRAFYNVCRHRGTRMVVEPVGRLDRVIRCPYHAWSYELDGQLAGAPSMNEVRGFDKRDYPLHPVALAEWEGGLFVNLSPSPEPFETAWKPLLGRPEAWGLPELAVAHRIEYDVRANWKLVFQNYSECYHCPSLHPALNRLSPYRGASNDLLEGPFLGGPMLMSQKGGSMTMSGQRCAPPLPKLVEKDHDLVYYYTIFPSMLLSLHPDYVLIHRVCPRGAERTEVVCEWLFHPDAMAEDGFDPEGAISFWNTTNGQDWRVSEQSQLGIGSRVYTPGPYAELESMLAAWDREYLRSLGDVRH